MTLSNSILCCTILPRGGLCELRTRFGRDSLLSHFLCYHRGINFWNGFFGKWNWIVLRTVDSRKLLYLLTSNIFYSPSWWFRFLEKKWWFWMQSVQYKNLLRIFFSSIWIWHCQTQSSAASFHLKAGYVNCEHEPYWTRLYGRDSLLPQFFLLPQRISFRSGFYGKWIRFFFQIFEAMYAWKSL